MWWYAIVDVNPIVQAPPMCNDTLAFEEIIPYLASKISGGGRGRVGVGGVCVGRVHLQYVNINLDYTTV